MAEGKMHLVNEALLANNRADLVSVANRVYLGQGRSPQLNAAALQDMKLFLDLALSRADLKQAMVEGRIARAEETLIADGKLDMCAAANRVYLTENRRAQLSRDVELASMRAIADFADQSPEFRQALAEGRMDMAARVALAAGHEDISLRHIQLANYVVGEHRNFVPELHRLVAVADSPSFRQAVDQPGWGRLVATANAESWRMTVDAVRDGKMQMHQQ
jgi:hypothetical protein